MTLKEIKEKTLNSLDNQLIILQQNPVETSIYDFKFKNNIGIKTWLSNTINKIAGEILKELRNKLWENDPNGSGYRECLQDLDDEIDKLLKDK